MPNRAAPPDRAMLLAAALALLAVAAVPAALAQEEGGPDAGAAPNGGAAPAAPAAGTAKSRMHADLPEAALPLKQSARLRLQLEGETAEALLQALEQANAKHARQVLEKQGLAFDDEESAGKVVALEDSGRWRVRGGANGATYETRRCNGRVDVYALAKEYEEETLEYEVRWNGVPAGTSRMTVHRQEPFNKGPECWFARMVTESNPVVSTIYPVKDKAKTVIDMKGGFSRQFYLRCQEGPYYSEERIKFDYTLGSQVADYERPRPRIDPGAAADREEPTAWRTTRIPLYGRVLDPLAALYYLRALDLKGRWAAREKLREDREAGRIDEAEQQARTKELEVVLPVCTERRVWDTRLELIGREQITVPALPGARWCLEAKVDCGFSGLFQRKDAIHLWLDEATGIPLKMTTELPIGPCEVVLRSVENGPFE